MAWISKPRLPTAPPSPPTPPPCSTLNSSAPSGLIPPCHCSKAWWCCGPPRPSTYAPGPMPLVLALHPRDPRNQRSITQAPTPTPRPRPRLLHIQPPPPPILPTSTPKAQSQSTPTIPARGLPQPWIQSTSAEISMVVHSATSSSPIGRAPILSILSARLPTSPIFSPNARTP